MSEQQAESVSKSANSNDNDATEMKTTLKVRKPKAILFDIVGTVTKPGFVNKVVRPFVRNNIGTFLDKYWGNEVLMRDIKLLRAETLQDGGPYIVPSSEPADKIRQSVVEYVIRCMDEARNNRALRLILFHVIFDGNNHLQTPIYSDVAISLRNWSTKDGIKLYVFSNGWKYAMKKFLSKTNHGNLSLMVEEFMDHWDWGQLNDAKSYENIVAKLGYPAEDVLLLAHSDVQGLAAHSAGLRVVLVTNPRDELHREWTEETQKANLPFIWNFNDLVFAGDAPPASTLGSSTKSQPALNSKLSGSKSSYGSSSKGTTASGSNSKGQLRQRLTQAHPPVDHRHLLRATSEATSMS